MLAQTFKTAEELRISERLYKALVEVYWLLVDERIPAKLFDMRMIGSPQIVNKHCCGSAGCLLGWAMAVDTSLTGQYEHDAIGRLFYPEDGLTTMPPYTANRAQAARALYNYLTSGKADWRGAMKG
jgi:hypothetical protein